MPYAFINPISSIIDRSMHLHMWHTDINVKISSHLHILLPGLDPIPLTAIIILLESHPITPPAGYIEMKFVKQIYRDNLRWISMGILSGSKSSLAEDINLGRVGF